VVSRLYILLKIVVLSGSIRKAYDEEKKKKRSEEKHHTVKKNIRKHKKKKSHLSASVAGGPSNVNARRQ